MSASVDDHLLLRQYAGAKSEEAFAEVVKRHLDHTYSTALREANDPHLAADLTQAAFIILARKAGKLKASQSVAGWLFQTVRYAARNARRAAWRREHYEKEAAAMNTPSTEAEPNATWEQLAPLLNEGLAALSASDRDIVTLRFFEKKSHEEIAARLGLPDTAARKRLSRAIDRLRRFFARRGVAVAGTSVMVVLTAQGVQAAPPGLAATVTASALAQGAAASASVLALVEGAAHLMTWAKVKVAAGIAVVAAIFSGGVLLSDQSRFRVEEVQFTSRFEHRASGLTMATRSGATNLFVLTAQKAASGLGGGPVDRLLRLFPQAVVNRLQVVDDFGNTFETLQSRSGTAFDAKGRKFDLWQLPMFPRRGTNLLLRFFELRQNGFENQVAEFKLRQPAPVSRFALTAEPLPARKTTGDLGVTLERFEAGHPQDGLNAPVPEHARSYPATCLTLALDSSDGTDPLWTARSVEISDPTGNLWRTDLFRRELLGPGRRVQAAFSGALWAAEPAWHLEVELVRTGGFALSDMVAVDVPRVPAAGEVLLLNQEYRVGGSLFRVVALTGTNALLPAPYQPFHKAGHMMLHLATPASGVGQQTTLLAVTDDQGRPVAVNDRLEWEGQRTICALKPAPEARSLRLQMARVEVRRVAFTARPTQVPSGGPAR